MRQAMEKNRVLHKRRKRVAGILALAAVCIGAAELVVCRYADPALYWQVTAPARACARAAADTGRAAMTAAAEAAHAAAASAAQTAAGAQQAFLDAVAPIEVTMPKKTASRAAAAKVIDESQLAGPSSLPAPQGMVDETVSRLEGLEGLELLTGGGIDVVYYNQTDEAWSSAPYGSDRLGGYGCGPTAMSMAVSSLTDEQIDPAAMARECAGAGYWCHGSGSYLSIVQGIAASHGLECRAVPPEQLTEEALQLHLSTGGLAVALMTRGHFTRSGHFIILRGLTLSGDILVADPASRERSLTPWSYSLIVSELSPSRHDGAPLWLLSRPT